VPSRREAKDAVAQARDIVDRDQDILGSDHPETLKSQMKLAKALVDAGESRAALALLGTILPIAREVHGETSRETLRVEELLAPLQRKAGALNIAKTRQERLLTAVIRDWGLDNDITFWVKRELAKTLLDLGSVDEASALLQETLDECIRVHGDRHMETLRTMGWLANAKREARDYRGAQVLDAEVLQCAIAMEVDVRFILDTKRRLMVDAAGLNQWVEMLELGEELVTDAQARLPEDDDLRMSIERQQKLIRLLKRNPGGDGRQFKQLSKILEDPVKSEQFNRRLKRKMRKEDLPDL
jgi:Tetratricopeptide repeat